MTDLPAGGVPYTIALVCLGNICRSPTAHVVLEARLREAGLADLVAVTSSGTGDWHTGEEMDSRAAAELAGAGYDPTRHRAQQFVASWFDRDLILAMDSSNLADIRALAPADVDLSRVRLFREFDPEVADGLAGAGLAGGAGRAPDVPDPWHGGRQGFTDVLAMVERTCDRLVSLLSTHLR